MNGRLALFLGALLLLALPPVPRAGAEEVQLSNEFLQVRITSRGGRIDRFVYTAWNAEKDWIVPVPHEGYGFLLDHFTCQTWPGELLGAEYDLSRRDGAVIASCPVRGAWDGKEFPTIGGLRLVKEIRLAEGFPALFVKVRVENPTDEASSFQFWAQQVFAACGGLEHDAYLRPTTRGVLRTLYPGTGADERFVTDVTAGWMGRVDEAEQAGIALIMDYNRLHKLYNVFRGGTSEWMYYHSALPAGREWQTGYLIRPFRDFGGLDFASEDLLVRLLPREGPGAAGVQVTVELAAAAGPLRGLRVAVDAIEPVSYEPAASGEFAVGALGAEKISRQVNLGIDDPARYLYRIRYEVGGRKASTVVNPFFAENNYRVKPPRKRPQLYSPDLSALKRGIADSRECLLVKGLFHDKWGLEEVLLSMGFRAEGRNSYDDIFGYHIQDFPDTYEGLFRYRLVALMNVAVSGLSPEQQVILKDYVLSGGALLVFGGLYGYGRGGYGEALFEEVLPVQADGPFDITIVQEPSLMKAAGFLREIGLKDSVALPVLAYHRVVLKPGAKSLMALSDVPVLAAWQTGEGRCCAVCATLHGEFPYPHRPFWEHREWADVLSCIVAWLTDREGGKG